MEALPIGAVFEKALYLWGPWAFVTALLAVLLWAARRENAALRITNAHLQEQRVEDVYKLIDRAEAMRATMAQRSATDSALTEALRRGAVIPPAPLPLPQPESR